MIETCYKLKFRLQMLHKSIVYDLYETRWQQIIIEVLYLHCESETFRHTHVYIYVSQSQFERVHVRGVFKF